MFNEDIKTMIKKYGFRSYEVAMELGTNEFSFSRKINRSELSKDEKERIVKAIISLFEKKIEELKIYTACKE